MCGRFSNNAKPKQIEKEFNVKVSEKSLFKPRYNIAPTQTIAVLSHFFN
jgi:putative SOS response-associated peptidase YedK